MTRGIVHDVNDLNILNRGELRGSILYFVGMYVGYYIPSNILGGIPWAIVWDSLTMGLVFPSEGVASL